MYREHSIITVEGVLWNARITSASWPASTTADAGLSPGTNNSDLSLTRGIDHRKNSTENTRRTIMTTKFAWIISLILAAALLFAPRLLLRTTACSSPIRRPRTPPRG